MQPRLLPANDDPFFFTKRNALAESLLTKPNTRLALHLYSCTAPLPYSEDAGDSPAARARCREIAAALLGVAA